MLSAKNQLASPFISTHHIQQMLHQLYIWCRKSLPSCIDSYIPTRVYIEIHLYSGVLTG